MNISKLCYELYKADWKRNHITPEIEMDIIKNYYEDCADSDGDYTYDEYLNEFGYDGELYVCYEEFYENEYRDVSYICWLLDNNKLIEDYIYDVKQIRL